MSTAVLVERGVDLFRQGAFHAAHEPWEAAWLITADGPLREGLRGLVQWAAAAHHVAHGRTAAGLLSRASPRLRTGSGELRAIGLRRLVAPADTVALGLSVAQPWQFLQVRRPPPLGVAALVLAGGHGRRAGGPKALKRRDGQLLWRWQCDQLTALGCRPLAVLHPDAWRAEHERPSGHVRAEPDQPPFASLQAGLRALPPGDVLVLPVDCPCPPRPVWVAVVAAAREAEVRGRTWLAVQPEHDGRGGHPVLLSAAWRAALEAMDPTTARLDHALASASGRLRVPVDDGGIHANFNLDGVGR
jgi:CTP:molybdopterin cytidylyltransferase MocA